MPAIIHPTAILTGNIHLADDVHIGPFSILEGDIALGSGCVIGPHCHLLGTIRAGVNNHFYTGCVIGNTPQHLGYQNEPTTVEIGDSNIFREYVTVHRGMPGVTVTTIGHRNLFMVNSHVAHDCIVGNNAIFANSSVIGGHAKIGDGAFLSGNTCVHQFCRVGKLAMLSGTSSVSQDLPPFWVVQEINIPRGVNLIGMRRAGIPAAEIQGVRRAFKAINREGLTIAAALEKIEHEDGELPAVQDLLVFIRESKRGIVVAGRSRDDTP